MLRLTRTVRVSINPGGSTVPAGSPNGYAATPSMVGLGRHYEFTVTCRGELDAAVGYLLDIKAIDQAVRTTLVPRIEEACATPHSPAVGPVTTLAPALAPLNAALGGRVTAVRWHLSPYYSVEMSPAPNTPEARTTALLRQRFDFAAAHRLHMPSLSDAENRRLFGKCNNPGGHGHNYQFEPCIELDPAAMTPFTLQDLEAIAQTTIINRFDHVHLNQDTPEFDTARGGVNPSVENIAKVFYDLLSAAIKPSTRARLREVTVWETDRTSATFPG